MLIMSELDISTCWLELVSSYMMMKFAMIAELRDWGKKKLIWDWTECVWRKENNVVGLGDCVYCSV